MISIKVSIDPAKPSIIAVEIDAALTSQRRALNTVLANRLKDELQDHLRRKNAEPNKRGWAKSGFWGKVSEATDIIDITEDGAMVAIADYRFRIHLFGGDIEPIAPRKALSIPLIEAARNLRPRAYEQQMGHRLFTIPGRHALFERTNAGTESVIHQTMVKVKGEKRSMSIPLAARSRIRPVYALASSVTIPADPDALPSEQQLQDALLEEATDFLARTFPNRP